ncbi:hypothetical protein JCGZ_22999 [Jatropha curcas]|uniref:Uncharacterized protein n=1 Tax=Jatropha curcas TaxID=180498 RepID=A0A067JSY2_JATCU|nr:hypothetical protein JCGZ_22999 [Jatropha curcas]
MPPRYKRSRPASLVVTRNQPIARPSAASPPMLLLLQNPARPVYDSVGGGKGTRRDLDVMVHMKLVEKGASHLSNDEVLARTLSQMDMFDTRLNGMESMIADRFQCIKITHGSLDSSIDTMQGQYQGIVSQLQTVIQLL